MKPRFWVAAVLAACMGPAIAAGPGAVRKQVESSMLVTGTIDLAADGRVSGYAIDGRDTLPPGVAQLIDRTVPQWRFAPVELLDGTTRARASMNLRLVAKKLGDGQYRVEIRGTRFGTATPGEFPAPGNREPPRYPKEPLLAGVGGSAYIVLKIGRDGRVADAFAEQVNLRAVAGEAAMKQWRGMFAQAALRAVRQWTFVPPSKGAGVDVPYWHGRVAIEFIPPGGKDLAANEWHSYVPGPRTPTPWAAAEDASAADVLTASSIHPVGDGPRLLTPPDPAG